MFKKIILLCLLTVVVGLIAYWIYNRPKTPALTQQFILNAKSCTYSVDGKDITLKDGYAAQAINADSATKLITRYFGNELAGYFDDDEFSDRAFILTQESGGSGTFFYLAAALGSKDKCNGTNAILLGDRIAPQTTEFRNGEIIVNYAERRPEEPMTASPSVGVSKYL